MLTLCQAHQYPPWSDPLRPGSNVSAEARAARRPTDPALLAGLAAAGVVVYVLIDLALAFLRPGVSLLHDAESDYGVGPFSWLMDLNFLLRCALSLALVGALARLGSPRLRLGSWLLGAWAVCSGLLAFFPDDPPGYPVTTAGQIHLLLAFVGFICVAVAAILLALRFRELPALAPGSTALLTLGVLAVLALLLLGGTHLHPRALGGLWERLFLALELAWILVASLCLRRASPASV